MNITMGYLNTSASCMMVLIKLSVVHYLSISLYSNQTIQLFIFFQVRYERLLHGFSEQRTLAIGIFVGG